MRSDAARVGGARTHIAVALRNITPLIEQRGLGTADTYFLGVIRERLESGAWMTKAEEARIAAIRGEIARQCRAQGA